MAKPHGKFHVSLEIYVKEPWKVILLRHCSVLKAFSVPLNSHRTFALLPPRRLPIQGFVFIVIFYQKVISVGQKMFGFRSRLKFGVEWRKFYVRRKKTRARTGKLLLCISGLVLVAYNMFSCPRCVQSVGVFVILHVYVNYMHLDAEAWHPAPCDMLHSDWNEMHMLCIPMNVLFLCMVLF